MQREISVGRKEGPFSHSSPISVSIILLFPPAAEVDSGSLAFCSRNVWKVGLLIFSSLFLLGQLFRQLFHIF